MCVGLAVDYAVHFTHFYNEAPGNRFEKAQGALHGVGVSVIGGAVTTAGAAIPMMISPNSQGFHEASPLALQLYNILAAAALCVSVHSEASAIRSVTMHGCTLNLRCIRGPLCPLVLALMHSRYRRECSSSVWRSSLLSSPSSSSSRSSWSAAPRARRATSSLCTVSSAEALPRQARARQRPRREAQWPTERWRSRRMQQRHGPPARVCALVS